VAFCRAATITPPSGVEAGRVKVMELIRSAPLVEQGDSNRRSLLGLLRLGDRLMAHERGSMPKTPFKSEAVHLFQRIPRQENAIRQDA
jgi:hypothetical protein